MTSHKPEEPIVQSEVSDTEVIALAEEKLRVGKRTVTTGRVRVRTAVEVETEIAKASLDGETVEVERVAIDRIVDEAPGIRTEGDVTVIPVMEEVLVVEKRLVLKEELHIRKRVTTEAVEIPVELRKQHAVIERIPAEDDDTAAKP